MFFPQTEVGNDAGAIRAFAQAAEELGYEHLLTYEHVLGANPEGREAPWLGRYSHLDPFHEPFVLLGHLAAVTRSIVLGTAVLVLPQRQTVLVAKQAAEIDVLSAGRFRLGVGLGWNTIEYQALGADFATRGARIEEQIAVLRALWTQELVSFRGRWHVVDDAGLNPMPVRRPIPIWMAGESARAVDRVGRVADGWFPGGPWVTPFKKQPPRPPEWFEAAAGDMRDAARRAGRDPTQIAIAGRVRLGTATTPDAWAAEAQWWRERGATHVTVNTMRAGLADADAHIAALERAAAVLLPA